MPGALRDLHSFPTRRSSDLVGVRENLGDVAFRAREEIVQADDLGAGTDQAVTKVAPQESRPAGDHNSLRRHAENLGWNGGISAQAGIRCGAVTLTVRAR